ncbi:MAG TPA: rhodanese-like domain-containing protein [Nitrospirae bacterium]|nr:molybdopterin biosynthesis-like protein MoeZ [bacterium BMS3Abin09]GBE41255.1 molybdopterin biosynthesis-like protein MoeZ [bacterium BMS3Bbin09]HDH33892.1 rhodanese-like domain-containing protein [Nitrospirota bacterium]HDN94663.1 rhodanese-like domain-containing protein [Nitrospirota bacterium]HDO66611.1 rhodanese-like domain-containing protein [Nitrospirota bacterium]
MLRILKILIAVIVLLSVLTPAFAADDNSQRIKAKELKALIDKGETILIVDVRSPDEFLEMHITGALSVPIHLIDTKLAVLSPDTKIAFYCT